MAHLAALLALEVYLPLGYSVAGLKGVDFFPKMKRRAFHLDSPALRNSGTRAHVGRVGARAHTLGA